MAERQRAIERDGATKARFGIAHRATPHEHTTELVVGCSNIGLRRDSKAQMLFGLFKLIEPSQRFAEMIVRRRMTRRELERTREQLACLLIPPAQMQHAAEGDQRPDRGRLQSQRFAQASLRRVIVLELALA